MLVISRKENQSIRLEPAPDVDPAMTLLEAFQQGAIVVKLMRVGARRVRLVIEAPRALRVSRDQGPEEAATQGRSDAFEEARPSPKEAGA